jgi:ABC-type transporter MlaC component
MMPIVKKIVEHGTALMALFGVLWFVAQPSAQEFVRQTVADRLSELEQGVAKLDEQQEADRLSLTRQESDLASIKAVQQETRDDVRSILLELRRN